MVGASRRYDGPMGKSDRALRLRRARRSGSALGGAAAGAGPRWLMPVRRGARCAVTIVNRVRARPRRSRGAADELTRTPRHGPHAPRPQRAAASRTHDGVDALLPPLAGARGARGAARSCCSTAATSTRGRMAHLVDELDLPDFDFFAWDARGHGRSPGARGHAPSFGDLGARRRDLRRPHRARRTASRSRTSAVVAQSVGRGARRDLGARLRAADPRRWCSPRRPSR